jgi:hypothetical protein
MGDAMVLSRSRSREGVAENDCDGNCKFCLAQHFFLLSSFAIRLSALDAHHETRLCAHAPNPPMHRASATNTAAFNTASIMASLH